MELNILRSLATLAIFIAFIGICLVVYSGKRKDFYEQAGRMALQDDPDDHSDKEETA